MIYYDKYVGMIYEWEKQNTSKFINPSLNGRDYDG